jgi:hypothetical protein
MSSEKLSQRLDNDVTLLYKFAVEKNVPVGLIFLERDERGDIHYVSMFEQIKGVDLEEIPSILESLTDQIKEFDEQDLLMGYYRENLLDYDKKETLEKMNQLAQLLDMGNKRFPNIRNIENEYELWKQGIDDELEETKEEVNQINQIQSRLIKLAKKQKLQFSEPQIFSATFSFFPTHEGAIPILSDGIEIFDKSIPSIYAPYIGYRDGLGNLNSKVFKGNKVEDRPNYQTSIPPDAVVAAPNTLYIQLWLADLEKDPSQTLKDTPKEFFRRVVYDLESNSLYIETPIESSNRVISDEKQVFERIQAAFPTLELGESKQIKLRAEFVAVYPDKKVADWFDEVSMGDMLINDDLFTSYLYMEEQFTPFPFKKKLWLHYKSLLKDRPEKNESVDSNYAAVSTWYTKKETSKDQRITMRDPVTEKEKDVEFGLPQEYLNFSVPSAESIEVLNQFILVFKLLMEYYITERKSVLDIYDEYVGEIDTGAVQKTANLKKTRKSKNGNLQILKEQAPEIFVSGFATKCQANAHPEILTDEERKQYEKEGKQTIEFPLNPDPGQRQYTFGCPGDGVYKYIGVFPNTLEGNNKKFPYLPCCYRKDHLNKTSSAWADYKLGAKPTKLTEGAKADKKLVTNKILKEGGTGFLPKAVDKVLTKYPNRLSDDSEFSRYGVIRSPSSLIHCVLYSIGDQEYLKMKPEAKEKYAIKARKWMSDNVFPSLLKQQMYDYGDEEITEYLADQEQFLDPNFVHRAIEELFEVNVYTFSAPAPGDEGSLGNLQLPRFNTFLCKAHNPNRPTILLLRSEGSTSDKLKFPQIELIVESSANDYNSLFDLHEQSMGPYCDALVKRILGTRISKFDNKGLETFDGSILDLDFSLVFDLPITEQFIDSYGKMRGINIDGATIITPPSQPLNLPETKTQLFAKSFTFMKGFKLTESTPEGNWYELLGEKQGLFVPKAIITDIRSLPNPIRSTGKDYTERIYRLKRTLLVIKQVLVWAYKLYSGTVSSFFDNHVIVNEDNETDSSTFYNVEDVPETLPTAISVNDALGRIPTESNIVRRVKGTKYAIVCYNEDFRDKLQIYLANVYRSDIDARKLKGYYQNEENFRKNANVMLFTNRADLEEWVQFTSIGNSKVLKKTVKEKYGKNPEPYLYQTQEGKIYIVQNVNAGYKDLAMTVGQKWIEAGYNPGFNGTTAQVNLDTYTVGGKEVSVAFYTISVDGTIALTDMVGTNESEYLRVLFYGSAENYIAGSEGKYAALLEVL